MDAHGAAGAGDARSHVTSLLGTLRAWLALRVPCPQCASAPAGPDGPCRACRERPLRARRDGDVIALGGYGGGLGSLVRAAKFAGAPRAIDHLCAALAEALREAVRDDPVLRAAPLVPVPSHPRRRRSRGSDTALRVATGVAAHAPGHRVIEALVRRRLDPPQSTRRRAERHGSVDGAFAVRAPWRSALRGRRVVLVDDVLTSGTTARAAGAALAEAGAEAALLLVVAGPGATAPRIGATAR